MSPTTDLAPLLERFFTQRLMQERRVSPHTIGSCLLHRSFLTAGRWVPDDETGVISTRCRGVCESRVAED